MNICTICQEPKPVRSLKERIPRLFEQVRAEFRQAWEFEPVCDSCYDDMHMMIAFAVEFGRPFNADELERYVKARMDGMDIRRLRFRVE